MGIASGLRDSSLLAKLCFLIIFTANVGSWISFTTTSWGITDDKYYTGIWRFCNMGDPNNKYCAMLDGFAKVWFGVFQAFACIGFAGLNASCLIIALYMCGGSCHKNSETGLCASVCCIFTAIFWLIAVIIFGAKFEDDSDVSLNGSKRLGFSFGLAVASLGLELIVGVLMILVSRKL
ncbi:epithelial membrane protein 1 [Biomphalaria glabrata]